MPKAHYYSHSIFCSLSRIRKKPCYFPLNCSLRFLTLPKKLFNHTIIAATESEWALRKRV